MSLRTIIEQTTHALGAGSWIRSRHRQFPRILMYHRFHSAASDISTLRAQCAHLRRHYHPVSLSEVAASLREQRPLPPNSLAITIDDGYRDFAIAFPLFREYGFTPTLYVVPEFAEGRLWLWPDVVLYLVETTPLRRVQIPFESQAPFDFDVGDRAQLAALYQRIVALPNAERLSLLRQLPALFAIPLPSAIPDRFAPLSFDELRAMVKGGLDVGAHTRTHPILARLETRDLLHAEITECKSQLEAALGRPVRHFCYPNGTKADFTPECVEEARAAGYETAVTAEAGLVRAGADPYQLLRVGVDPDYQPLYFERCVAGHRL